MCGIIAKISTKDVSDYLFAGLKDLEYRGYDSCGIVYFDKNNDFVIKKSNQRIEKLKIETEPFNSNIGMGHTRWATHGEKSIVNAHPHISYHKTISIVHNGTISNYQELKRFLVDKGYKFYSKTDTEVVVNYLEYLYLTNNDMLESIKKLNYLLKGSYAFVFMHQFEKKLYFLKKRAPLIVAKSNCGYLVASDHYPLMNEGIEYYDIPDNNYGFITENVLKVYFKGKNIKLKPYSLKKEINTNELNNYHHFMEKEIFEIGKNILQIVRQYMEEDKETIQKVVQSLKKVRRVFFIASGTSYHAANSAMLDYEDSFKSVLSISSGEFIYRNIKLTEYDFVIALSQSGETADLLHALDKVKECPILAITNSYNSSLNRFATYSLYLHCGKETAVASTKSFVFEFLLLELIINEFKENNNFYSKIESLQKGIEDLYQKKDLIYNLSCQLKNYKDGLILGRGRDFFVAQEGALKIKEVSYIHMEALYGGEMKHGPIALVTDSYPIIIIISDNKFTTQTKNTIEEISARKGNIIIISSIPELIGNINLLNTDYSHITIAICLMLTSYYLGVIKNLDVDKPRNLAKSVTVE